MYNLINWQYFPANNLQKYQYLAGLSHKVFTPLRIGHTEDD
jgi:hypothetical protein